MMKAIHGIFFVTLFSFGALAQQGDVLKNDKTPPPAHEQEEGYRGMEDARIMTIQQAMAMHQGASVSLRGNLVQKSGENRYLLRDKTGEIDVMIPPAVAKERQASPDELVGISGTLEKKGNDAHVVVSHFQKQ